MKLRLYPICYFLCATGLIFTAAALAKPEQIEIKSEETKAQEAKAKFLARGIDLSKVEDPDTRLALATILYSIGLREDEKTHGEPDPHLALGKGVQDERPL
jgi:hypothetical protein